MSWVCDMWALAVSRKLLGAMRRCLWVCVLATTLLVSLVNASAVLSPPLPNWSPFNSAVRQGLTFDQESVTPVDVIPEYLCFASYGAWGAGLLATTPQSPCTIQTTAGVGFALSAVDTDAVAFGPLVLSASCVAGVTCEAGEIAFDGRSDVVHVTDYVVGAYVPDDTSYPFFFPHGPLIRLGAVSVIGSAADSSAVAEITVSTPSYLDELNPLPQVRCSVDGAVSQAVSVDTTANTVTCRVGSRYADSDLQVSLAVSLDEATFSPTIDASIPVLPPTVDTVTGAVMSRAAYPGLVRLVGSSFVTSPANWIAFGFPRCEVDLPASGLRSVPVLAEVASTQVRCDWSSLADAFADNPAGTLTMRVCNNPGKCSPVTLTTVPAPQVETIALSAASAVDFASIAGGYNVAVTGTGFTVPSNRYTCRWSPPGQSSEAGTVIEDDYVTFPAQAVVHGSDAGSLECPVPEFTAFAEFADEDGIATVELAISPDGHAMTFGTPVLFQLQVPEESTGPSVTTVSLISGAALLGAVVIGGGGMSYYRSAMQGSDASGAA